MFFISCILTNVTPDIKLFNSIQTKPNQNQTEQSLSWALTYQNHLLVIYVTYTSSRDVN